MALTTVLKCPVWSVYPNCSKNVRSLLSGIIRPREECDSMPNDCNVLLLKIVYTKITF